MKLVKISTLVLLGSALLFNSSCRKTFFTGANNNPNAPKTVTPSVLLATVEGSLAYTQGGDLSRFASMIDQQTAGVSRQSSAYYQYIFTNQDVDNTWANVYTSVMMNDDSLMSIADGGQYNEYSGIARVLMAYSLQITVDFWGKVPFSQALQGGGNIKPVYDDDKALYTKILSLCDDGIAKLNETSAGVLTPGAEDIIYGGDATAWIKFAHAIKARIYMHQSKNNATMASSALSEIALSFSSNSDNAKYYFDTKETFANPWYQFNEQRADISFVTGTMATTMLTLNDPRYTAFFDTSMNNPFIPGDALASYYGSINGIVEFITYDELQFMTAEANLTIGGAGSLASAQAAYQSGIFANMSKLGVATADITSYITANGTLSSTTPMAMVGYEENVALFLNPEAWTAWRRTGYPALTPVKGSSVPRRMVYPQTEYSYNKVNTPSATLYTPKIFWDN